MMESSRTQTSASSQLNPEEEINVYLKVMKTVAFKVNKSETVRNLKALFCEKEGTFEGVKDLFFAGDKLQDDKRLVDHAIQTDTSLYVVLQNDVGTKLHVKIPRNQKTITVIALAHHTVRDIRSMIQAKEGIPSYQFTLLYEGKLLRDDIPVASLNWKSEATLHLILNPKPVIWIFVKSPIGDILKLEIPVLLTVGDVKSLVGSMIDISVSDKIMIYEGEQLEDCKILAFYDVKEESLLEICPPSIQIFVKTETEDIVKVKIKVLFTVGDVKAIVGGEIGYSVSYQNLFYAGKKLEDSKTIACYDIKDLSVLVLKSQIQIFVKTWGGKTVTLDVELSNTVKDVKDKLFTKLQNPFKFQKFVFGGKQLEEDRDLASYNIQKHSTLRMVFSLTVKPPTTSKSTPFFIIRVKLSQYHVKVSRSTNIYYLKGLLQHIYRSPVKEILFNHVTLENQHTLGDYKLGNHSTVDVVFEEGNIGGLSAWKGFNSGARV